MNRQELIEVYKLYREQIVKSMDLHLQHFRSFLTILVGILGATIAGANLLKNEPNAIGVLLILGALVGVSIAISGYRICDRFYLGMLEGVTVTTKIEIALGFETKPVSEANGNIPIAFSEDKYLLPTRWIEGRNAFKTSNEFLDYSLSRGANTSVRQTFILFMLVNASILVYGFFLLI